jgi:hypothetical protein
MIEVQPPPAALAKGSCRGNPKPFDGKTRMDIAVAVKLCSQCPVLRDCHAWAKTWASNMGSTCCFDGVLAGKVYGDARKLLTDKEKKIMRDKSAIINGHRRAS